VTVVPAAPAGRVFPARKIRKGRQVSPTRHVTAAGSVHAFGRVPDHPGAATMTAVATKPTRSPRRPAATAHAAVAAPHVRDGRRRKIDPTTCERDYHPEEVEFMQALDAYKRSSGRMFPTCSEVLEVVRSLGYVRVATT